MSMQRRTLLAASLAGALPAQAAKAPLLAGGDTFNYEPAPAELVSLRDRVAALCAEHGVEVKAAALQFCAAPEAVACVVPGGRSAAEVAENARLIARPIPAALWEALRAEGLLPASAPVPA